MKKVKLLLEYDMGEYDDKEIAKTGGTISEDPTKWWDSFYQSDVYPSDLKIVQVIVEDVLEIEEEN